MPEQQRKQGWGSPGHSRKWHYFHNNWRSLCMKYVYTGELHDTNHDSPDNCAECKKRRDKLFAPPKPKKGPK